MSRFFTTLLLAFILVAALLFTNTANAADFTTSKDKVVSVDPLDLLIDGRINATFEKKLSPKNSFTVNATYWGYDKYATAFGLGASYRWYFDLFEEGKSSLNGLSVGPRLDFFFWNRSYNNPSLEDVTYSTLAIGGEVNYKWVFGGGKWAVEPTIKFVIPVLKESGYSYTNYGLGINLGYCF